MTLLTARIRREICTWCVEEQVVRLLRVGHSPTPYVSKGRALSNDNLQKPIQPTFNGGKVLDNHCIVVDGITHDIFCFFLCLLIFFFAYKLIVG